MTGPYKNNNLDEKAKINKQQSTTNRQTTTKKKRIHDQFSDLMDYVMLDTMEREKHRLEVDRTHPVVERSDSEMDSYNPSIGEIKKIKLR